MWATRGNRSLAEADRPLVHEWDEGLFKQRVDSAQILQCLFVAPVDPALVLCYAALWRSLVAFADEVGVGPGDSRTIAEIRPMAPSLDAVATRVLAEGATILVDALCGS